NFSANNWTLTIADAVDFIFKVADSLNRPCVINASLGTYIGSHDGQDAAALIIDSLILDKPGRAMVCAAGNSGGEDPYHLRMDVDADTSFSWFQYNPTSGFGFGAVYFELWADTADMNGVSFAMGADKVTGGFSFRGNMPFDNIQNRLNQVVFDTIFGAGGHTIGTVQTWAEEINGRYFMQVLMPQPDSNQYFFRMMATGDGAFDVWSGSWLATSDMVFSGLPGVATFPDIAHYVLPDIQQSIVSSWACSPHVITVGNYTNRNSYLDVDSNLVTFSDVPGEISPNSSWGPARTGVLKPDVAAPGDISVTSGKLDHLTNLLAAPSLRPRVGLGGMHYRNGGTSMASPGVAGIAALYFQKCPQATAADILQALRGTASTDGFTGTVPNFQWGYGKANGFDALVGSNFSAPTVSATDG
ncbi:MAG: S8 family serine peptidase, partial [Bacteroidota bacterium]